MAPFPGFSLSSCFCSDAELYDSSNLCAAAELAMAIFSAIF